MNIKEFVDKALGVPFKTKGRDYSGFDCYGLMQCAYKDVLLRELPSYLDEYVDAGDTEASRRVIQDNILAQKHNWDQVDKPQAMDVAFFKLGNTGTHLGLMIDDKSFIHCEKRIGTVIERLDSAKWKSRVEGVYRLKNV
jgi:cell wall-associated NlpC family hydrolase